MKSATLSAMRVLWRILVLFGAFVLGLLFATKLSAL